MMFNKKNNKESFFESDNMGSRAETLAQANRLFDLMCCDPLDPTPFTLFLFSTEKAAEKALLKLRFMHRAADSGKIISELSIGYGTYEVPDMGYVAFVLGFALCKEGFEEAEKAFSRHGIFKNHVLPDGAEERFKVRRVRWSKQVIHYD